MTYVPPNKRTTRKARHNVNDFPPLGETKTVEATTLQYASAVRTEERKPVEEERVEPGWVKLSRCPYTGKVMRKGEPATNEWDTEEHRRDVVLKNLVGKWQRERDEANDVLDQCSPYWGMKDLEAPLGDEDLSDSEDEAESESESEMESDWSDYVED